MKKILNILEKIVLVLLIMLLIYALYSKYIIKNKLTTIGGYGFLVVLTGSMEPEIDSGELVIIKKEKNYIINDIITYIENNNFITHRIVEKQGEKIITKGDYNNNIDLSIKNSQILGKVVYHSKTLGIFVTKYLKILFIILIIFIFIRLILRNEKMEESIEK